MIQKDLQGNLWECKVFGTRSSGKTFQAYKQEIKRLNNIISNMEEELMTLYLDIMEYNEDYAKKEIKKLKGVDKE